MEERADDREKRLMGYHQNNIKPVALGPFVVSTGDVTAAEQQVPSAGTDGAFLRPSAPASRASSATKRRKHSNDMGALSSSVAAHVAALTVAAASSPAAGSSPIASSSHEHQHQQQPHPHHEQMASFSFPPSAEALALESGLRDALFTFLRSARCTVLAPELVVSVQPHADWVDTIVQSCVRAGLDLQGVEDLLEELNAALPAAALNDGQAVVEHSVRLLSRKGSTTMTGESGSATPPGAGASVNASGSARESASSGASTGMAGSNSPAASAVGEHVPSPRLVEPQPMPSHATLLVADAAEQLLAPAPTTTTAAAMSASVEAPADPEDQPDAGQGASSAASAPAASAGSDSAAAGVEADSSQPEQSASAAASAAGSSGSVSVHPPRGRYRSNLPQLDRLTLTDGGLETGLLFLHGVALEHFASFPLLAQPDGRELLKSWFLQAARTAVSAGFAFSLDTPCWRANKDWAVKLGCETDEHLDSFLCAGADLITEVRREVLQELTGGDDAAMDSAPPIVLCGCMGPRGDGYVAGAEASTMTAEEAREYHRRQVEVYALHTDVDYVGVATLSYPAEGIGIALAAKDVGIPCVISFTIETNGRLASGHSIAEAVVAVDRATGNYPAYYAINCAHPSHLPPGLLKAASSGSSWASRIRAFRANASRKSHAELDNCCELDSGNPEELAQELLQLTNHMPQLRVLGGCCGTDNRHLAALVQALIRAEDEATATAAAVGSASASEEQPHAEQQQQQAEEGEAQQHSLGALQEELEEDEAASATEEKADAGAEALDAPAPAAAAARAANDAAEEQRQSQQHDAQAERVGPPAPDAALHAQAAAAGAGAVGADPVAAATAEAGAEAHAEN
jgi:homocysteine S-methyltransferase